LNIPSSPKGNPAKRRFGRSTKLLAALILLIGIAAISIATIAQLPSRRLAALGYDGAPEKMFLRAVGEGQTEVTRIFARQGLHIKAQNFPLLFNDLAFNPAILDILIENGSVDASLCPTEMPLADLYSRHAADEQRASYLKRICGKEDVVARLRAAQRVESQKSEQADTTRQAEMDTLQQCPAKYLKEGEYAVIAAAARINILKDEESERDCVLRKIYVDLLSNNPALRRSSELFNAYVAECCQKYHPVRAVSRGDGELLQAAIQFLSAANPGSPRQ
jgi:hypothetical protein